jgi:hypothetical protein
MYDIMNQKMKEYSTNENKLLNNVRNTILKTFEKEEKNKNSLQRNMEFCQNQLDIIKKETEKSINFYKELNNKIKIEIDTLKSDMTRLNK